MKRLLRQISVTLLLAAAFSSCAPDDSVDIAPYTADHTLVFYILADNNLASYMLANVEAAERGVEKGIPPTSRMVVYLDKTDTTKLFEVGYMPYGTNNHIKYAKCLKTYPKEYSTDPSVMRKVFSDIRTMVPSRSYSVVLSAHGTGWFPESTTETVLYNQRAPAVRKEYDFNQLDGAKMTRAWGYDHDKMLGNAWMSGQELAEGLADFDIKCLYFDACFMSSIELLYDLRNSARYIVASPTEVMGAGFPYEQIVPMILGNESDVRKIAAEIVAVYRDTSFGGEHSSSIAVIDCAAIEPFATAVRAIYDAGIDAVNLSLIQPLESMEKHAFYDLDDYITALTDDENLLSAYRTAFDTMVPFAENTEQIYSNYGGHIVPVAETLSLSGVSCYIPIDSAPVTKGLWLQTEWAKAIGADR